MSSTIELAFQTEILSNPEDETLWLMYADLMEEQGEDPFKLAHLRLIVGSPSWKQFVAGDQFYGIAIYEGVETCRAAAEHPDQILSLGNYYFVKDTKKGRFMLLGSGLTDDFTELMVGTDMLTLAEKLALIVKDFAGIDVRT